MWYVVGYLVAIVAANLSVAHFGKAATVVNAFFFISLDLTARDKLHDAWHGRRLWLKMVGLIAAGSALSWFLNRDAGRIGLASMAAFGAASASDALVYHFLRERAALLRMNGSNLLSAAVDSLMFPTLAFGGFDLAVTAGQWGAKVLGGLIWSVILVGGGKRRDVVSVH